MRDLVFCVVCGSYTSLAAGIFDFVKSFSVDLVNWDHDLRSTFVYSVVWILSSRHGIAIGEAQ